METIDWKLASFSLGLIQFIGMMTVSAIIKFNDLKHLDEDVRDLKTKQHEYELKQDERHIENIKSIGKLDTKISELVGKFNAMNNIKSEDN